MSQIPLSHTPPNGVSGMQLEIFNRAAPTWPALRLSPGIARDSAGNSDIIINDEIIIGNQNGINNLDVGVVQPEEKYSVFAIDNTSKKNAAAAILSLDENKPFLPDGYNVYRKINTVRSDINSNYRPFVSYGNGNYRNNFYYVGYEVLVDGGSFASYGVIELKDLVPSDDCMVYLNIDYRPSKPKNTGGFLPFDFPVVEPIIKFGGGVADAAGDFPFTPNPGDGFPAGVTQQLIQSVWAPYSLSIFPGSGDVGLFYRVQENDLLSVELAGYTFCL